MITIEILETLIYGGLNYTKGSMIQVEQSVADALIANGSALLVEGAGGSGAGAVSSVNGLTGDVVLGADDIKNSNGEGLETFIKGLLSGISVVNNATSVELSVDASDGEHIIFTLSDKA